MSTSLPTSTPAVCAFCALQFVTLDPDSPLCPHHSDSTTLPETWAAGNRVWCDFFYRGQVPQRVIDPPEPDFFEAYTGMTATGVDPGA